MGKFKLPFLAVLFCLVSVVSCSSMAASSSANQDYDLLVENGHIIDGTGSPWYSGSVAIRNGRIVAIGRHLRGHAKHVIDAEGMVVAPGFIDMLGQSDLSMLNAPYQASKISQGITTEITGEGESPAPQNANMIQHRRASCARRHLACDWHTFPEYFSQLRKRGLGINMGFYVGATSVREMVLGYADRTPNAAQLKQMQDLVADAMRAGAFGLSTALQYPPAPYAKTAELIALSKAAARFGGIYATHMRSEGPTEAAALKEAFEIGKKADIPVEIFHLKVGDKADWGTAGKLIAQINQERAAGVDVSADTYAYTAWNNDLASFTPPWANSGGTAMLIKRLKDPETRARIRADMLDPKSRWDDTWKYAIGGDASDILISSVGNEAMERYVGERMSDVAKQWDEDPLDAILDFLIKDQGQTGIVVFGMSPPDVSLILKQPWVSICTDSQGTSLTGIERKVNPHPHPRAYGTFSQIIHKYVERDHVLTLPDAIRKFSALAAQRVGLTKRGVIKVGMYADLVVFDPAKVRDRATYERPNQLSEGMDYVIVDGVPVIAAGKMTHALPGKILRGPGYTGGK